MRDTHYPYRIIINQRTSVEEKKIAGEVSPAPYSFRPFSEVVIGPKPQEHVDLAGIIVSIQEGFSTNYDADYKKITLQDESGGLVELLLWGNNATSPITSKWEEGQVMLVKGALITEDETLRAVVRGIRVIGVVDYLEDKLGSEAVEKIAILKKSIGQNKEDKKQ
jgi:hypothetical protein